MNILFRYVFVQIHPHHPQNKPITTLTLTTSILPAHFLDTPYSQPQITPPLIFTTSPHPTASLPHNPYPLIPTPPLHPNPPYHLTLPPPPHSSPRNPPYPLIPTPPLHPHPAHHFTPHHFTPTSSPPPPHLGTLYSRASFDRELRHSYSLLVSAIDPGCRPHVSKLFANVTVDIADENDNDPFFLFQETTLSL